LSLANLKNHVSIPNDPMTIKKAAYAYISATIAYSEGINKIVYNGTKKKFRIRAITLLNPYIKV